MHRLVQLATHKWLESHGRLGRWKFQFISNLDDAFPWGNYENWAICQPLFPHATIALDMKLDDRAAMLRQASWLLNSAEYARNIGAYVDAEKMNMRSVERRRELLGERHLDTLQSMNNLASTYWNQGRWDEAEKLKLEVLEAMRAVLGERHPYTLSSMNNLASTYMNQGRWNEAEKLKVEVLAASREVLGDRHSDTLLSINNLAST